jgi:hypothetical protein
LFCSFSSAQNKCELKLTWLDQGIAVVLTSIYDLQLMLVFCKILCTCLKKWEGPVLPTINTSANTSKIY